MKSNRFLLGILIAGISVFLTACVSSRVSINDMSTPPTRVAPPIDYARQLPPGTPALRKVAAPDMRAAWHADRASLLTALDHSIRYYTFPSSKRYFPVQSITHAQAASSLIAFREILTTTESADDFQTKVAAAFDVYESVGCDNMGTVLFTGYYTPILDASRTETAEFRWPLHKLPPDLIKDSEGRCRGRRTVSGEVVPYYSRKEIADGALKGQELVYLRDRFLAYVCTVQGSAQLRMRDGSLMKVAYHGNNGKEYTSIGKRLIADGILKKGELSLRGLTAFFKRRPDMQERYLPLNKRYVFFQESDLPPTGSLGRPVTPLRSLATDKRIFPRGALCFVDTELPKEVSPGKFTAAAFKQFMLDQDTGGAIRAPGRADIYIGIGDKAGRIAGSTLAQGRLYYLFLKGSAASYPAEARN
jgi:peptidoglycan lytic transglycosylase A